MTAWIKPIKPHGFEMWRGWITDASGKTVATIERWSEQQVRAELARQITKLRGVGHET